MNRAGPLYERLSSAYAQPMRTLIVDRDDHFVERLASALTLDGYEVSTRSSGHDAIELVAEHPPDALLLECHLADLDGTEVCRRVRRLRRDLRILMFSYSADVAERVRGLEAGADAYMSKPLAMVELRARLHALLRQPS